MNVPVRALTGTWEDERAPLIHGYSGTIWTVAVLWRISRYKPVDHPSSEAARRTSALETPFGWPLFTELSSPTLPSV